jgi:hypothetical protein
MPDGSTGKVTKRRIVTMVLAIAMVVVCVEAVLDLAQFGAEAFSAGMVRPWAANLASALLFSAAIASAYLAAAARRVAMLVFVLTVPFALFASMMPVYSAVRYGVPAEWQFVCPREAEAYGAPLAVLASMLVLPFARRASTRERRRLGG